MSIGIFQVAVAFSVIIAVAAALDGYGGATSYISYTPGASAGYAAPAYYAAPAPSYISAPIVKAAPVAYAKEEPVIDYYVSIISIELGKYGALLFTSVANKMCSLLFDCYRVTVTVQSIKGTLPNASVIIYN